MSVCPVFLTDCLALAADKCQLKAWYLLPRTACGCEDSLSITLFSIFLSPSPFLPTFSISFSQPASISLLYISISSLSLPLFLCSNSSPLFHLLSLFLASLSTSSIFSPWQIGA